MFGPATGTGYDYLRAGMTLLGLGLGAFSGYCGYLLLHHEPSALTAVLIVLAAPFSAGGWALWPFHLYMGMVTATCAWYGLLHTLACAAGWRRCGKGVLVFWALLAALLWAAGVLVGIWASSSIS